MMRILMLCVAIAPLMLESQEPAKTICIIQKNGNPVIKTEIASAILKWGKLTVVDEGPAADLALEVTQTGTLTMSGSGNQAAATLKDSSGRQWWSKVKGGGWAMSGWSNAWVGRAIAKDLIKALDPLLKNNKLSRRRIEPAPLPAAVEAAKTVFLLDQSNDYATLDELHARLKAWGRWQFVDAEDKADLLLLLSSTAQVSGTVSKSAGAVRGGSAAVPMGSGAVAGGQAQISTATVSRDIVENRRHLSVVSPKTRERIFLFSSEADSPPARTADYLVRQFQDRFPSQE